MKIEFLAPKGYSFKEFRDGKVVFEKEFFAPMGYDFKGVRDGKIVFEKEVLPTSWEEYCDNFPITAGECFVDKDSDIITFDEDQSRDSVRDANAIKNEETAKAILALNKLIQLRDVYRDGWLPNWNDDEQSKYCIIICRDYISRVTSYYQRQFLSFQTSELRDLFLENFKELIKEVKELL